MAGSQDAPGSTSDSEERPVRRRPAVRVAIGVLLVAGMIYGWTAMGRQKSRKQAEAVNAVIAAGGSVYFDYQWKDGKLLEGGQPQQAAWLRRLVGPEFFDRAVAIDLREVEPGDLLRSLRLMPYVVDLNVGGAVLEEGDLEAIGRCKGLERLDLSRSSISDQGVVRLDRLTNLVSLSLATTEVSDRSLDTIGRLKKLRALDVSRTSIRSKSRLSELLPHCRVTGP